MNARRSLPALVIGLALAFSGCASHSDKTAPIRSALDAGRPKEALGLINESLDVDSAQTAYARAAEASTAPLPPEIVLEVEVRAVMSVSEHEPCGSL